MNFSEYQERTLDTLITPHTNKLLKDNKDLLIARLALGVAGEGGEVAEKVKKFLRGDYKEDILREHLKKEIGDILWYCSALAWIMNLKLEDIAKINIEKLKDRRERDKVKGSGDNR